jgi:hypothetical protein
VRANGGIGLMKKSISTELTSANIAKVLAIIAEAPAKLASLSKLVPPDQLHQPLGDGERSVIDTAAHLLNTEARSADAIYPALLTNEPLMHDIHAERDWGNLMHYEQYPLPDLLAYYTFRRTVMMRVLNGLTEAQWARVIRQEGKQRKESVYWQARGLALHELEHLTDLESKLNPKGT